MASDLAALLDGTDMPSDLGDDSSDIDIGTYGFTEFEPPDLASLLNDAGPLELAFRKSGPTAYEVSGAVVVATGQQGATFPGEHPLGNEPGPFVFVSAFDPVGLRGAIAYPVYKRGHNCVWIVAAEPAQEVPHHPEFQCLREALTRATKGTVLVARCCGHFDIVAASTDSLPSFAEAPIALDIVKEYPHRNEETVSGLGGPYSAYMGGYVYETLAGVLDRGSVKLRRPGYPTPTFDVRADYVADRGQKHYAIGVGGPKPLTFTPLVKATAGMCEGGFVFGLPRAGHRDNAADVKASRCALTALGSGRRVPGTTAATLPFKPGPAVKYICYKLGFEEHVFDTVAEVQYLGEGATLPLSTGRGFVLLWNTVLRGDEYVYVAWTNVCRLTDSCDHGGNPVGTVLEKHREYGTSPDTMVRLDARDKVVCLRNIDPDKPCTTVYAVHDDDTVSFQWASAFRFTSVQETFHIAPYIQARFLCHIKLPNGEWIDSRTGGWVVYLIPSSTQLKLKGVMTELGKGAFCIAPGPVAAWLVPPRVHAAISQHAAHIGSGTKFGGNSNTPPDFTFPQIKLSLEWIEKIEEASGNPEEQARVVSEIQGDIQASAKKQSAILSDGLSNLEQEFKQPKDKIRAEIDKLSKRLGAGGLSRKERKATQDTIEELEQELDRLTKNLDALKKSCRRKFTQMQDKLDAESDEVARLVAKRRRTDNSDEAGPAV